MTNALVGLKEMPCGTHCQLQEVKQNVYEVGIVPVILYNCVFFICDSSVQQNEEFQVCF